MNKNTYEVCCSKCNTNFPIPFHTERSVLCPKCFKTLGDDKKERFIVVDMNHGRKKKKKAVQDDTKLSSGWQIDLIAYNNDGEATFEIKKRY